jgi:hypothetical protein
MPRLRPPCVRAPDSKATRMYHRSPADEPRQLSKRERAKRRAEAYDILGRVARALARDQAKKDFTAAYRRIRRIRWTCAARRPTHGLGRVLINS